MTELHRIRDDGDPFERELLASARGDRMSPAAKRALVAAVPLAVVAGAEAAGGAAAGAAGDKAAAKLALLGKWAAIVTIGSALVVAAALPSLRGGPVSPAHAPLAAREHTPHVTWDSAPPDVARAAEPDAPRPSRVPAPPSRSAAKREAPVAAAPPGEGSSETEAASLAAELRLIEQARASLAGDRPRDALAALDLHRGRFARGLFQEEAAALRIDAHARAGDDATARALARAFLEAAPNSPYAPRVRGVVRALDRGAPR